MRSLFFIFHSWKGHIGPVETLVRRGAYIDPKDKVLIELDG